ncbi:MAG: hypothetical protein F6K53_15200 [Moorea sp. SIO4A1]|nr:hypothetical protein [Moorena sp. SIO4A1]NEQ58672.1 hypothetical protein [Moorena sp. SIO4A1]
MGRWGVFLLSPYFIHDLRICPLNPPILGDFDIITPHNWGARGAKDT